MIRKLKQLWILSESAAETEDTMKNGVEDGLNVGDISKALQRILRMKANSNEEMPDLRHDGPDPEEMITS